MRRVKFWRDDRGSATLEVAAAGLVLLVPLIYLIVVVGTIQSAALAAEGAARQAARVVATSVVEAEARAAADRAVTIALDDAGVVDADATVTIACAPDPSTCLRRQGTVAVTVRIDVTLPLLPGFFGADAPPHVPVEARSVQRVSRFVVAEP